MQHGIPLSSLLEDVPVLELRGSAGTAITGIACDSREVHPGFLFVAMEGVHADGHRFIGDALRNGASAVVHRQPPAERAAGVAWVRVEDPRRSL